MAEAVVDGTPMSRFFCHKCSIEIERLLPDYTCPRCASGFIEELESSSSDSMDISSGMDISSEDISDIDDIPLYNLTQPYDVERDVIEVMLGLSNRGQTSGTSNRNNGPAGRRQLNSTRNVQDVRYANGPDGEVLVGMSPETFLQDFILNLSRTGLTQPATQDGQPAVFNTRLFLGNPGDYVWGQYGLDAIVTQLLNQLDGTGPPPLPRKQIDEIPTIAVTQNQVDSKLQCSVCWEDFKLSEPVRQLSCQHVYHSPCIVPWLELHGTCPICRQSFGDQNSTEANQDTVGPSLAALFRAANESNNIRTSSTSSSGGNNSSNNTTSEI